MKFRQCRPFEIENPEVFEIKCITVSLPLTTGRLNYQAKYFTAKNLEDVFHCIYLYISKPLLGRIYLRVKNATFPHP